MRGLWEAAGGGRRPGRTGTQTQLWAQKQLPWGEPVRVNSSWNLPKNVYLFSSKQRTF